jgi:hypothetical protein
VLSPENELISGSRKFLDMRGKTFPCPAGSVLLRDVENLSIQKQLQRQPE